MIVKMAAATVLIVGLTACSHGSAASHTPPASVTDSATTGTLTGLVRMYGGPMNPKTGKQALNGSPGSDWPVKVLLGAKTVAERKSDSAGRFRFLLAPGRYTLACGQQSNVVVVAGKTVSVDCKVRVP